MSNLVRYCWLETKWLLGLKIAPIRQKYWTKMNTTCTMSSAEIVLKRRMYLLRRIIWKQQFRIHFHPTDKLVVLCTRRIPANRFAHASTKLFYIDWQCMYLSKHLSILSTCHHFPMGLTMKETAIFDIKKDVSDISKLSTEICPSFYLQNVLLVYFFHK